MKNVVDVSEGYINSMYINEFILERNLTYATGNCKYLSLQIYVVGIILKIFKEMKAKKQDFYSVH